ncbi:MAG: aldo/keto reductase [Anaerovibrio sp.]|uniref:aldo/keto reductase n=1 Tax=Anaerovibrio sp. TaxID=1872532 RepID=UPI0025F33D3F|nr:aldo/keto reductase [Anaerovibrio sp.]MCR5176764.1 aldo/keto reductase [Anaerovibrio sp.]
MELCLGTVQFGMDYGIRGQKQPSVEQAVDMLDYATQNGINNIDTANAYGTAEDVVGEFLSKKTIARDKLFVISKFRPNLLDDVDSDDYYRVMRGNLENTLSRLHTDYLDSYMLHSARYIHNDAIIDTLNRMKSDGLAKKVGVSVYEPEEAMKCIERPNVEFMQLPYSIFDQRMEKAGVFEAAKKDSIQIHSRSAFIQGLILMNEDEVPPFLIKARPIVGKISLLCQRHGLSRISLAMNYVKQQSRISHLVFGVDNIQQLKENINIFRESIPADIIEDIAREFTDIEADIVMPSLWKK